MGNFFGGSTPSPPTYTTTTTPPPSTTTSTTPPPSTTTTTPAPTRRPPSTSCTSTSCTSTCVPCDSNYDCTSRYWDCYDYRLSRYQFCKNGECAPCDECDKCSDATEGTCGPTCSWKQCSGDASPGLWNNMEYTLSGQDMVIVLLVFFNMLTVFAVIFGCVRSRWGKTRNWQKYQVVTMDKAMAAESDSEQERFKNEAI